jgi:hypothetical protein
MAIEFHSGFETGSTVEWSTVDGSPTVGTSPKKSGSYAMRCNTTAATAYVGVAAYPYRWSVWVYVGSLPNVSCAINGIYTGNDTVNIETDGHVKVFYAAGGLAGTSTTILQVGRWYRICFALNNVDAGKLYINGTLEITVASGLQNVTGREVGVETSSTVDLSFDDWVDDYGTDQTDIGDIRTANALPNAAGDLTQFTPSTGSNYTCVNELPSSDTKYVSHAPTATDLYNIQDNTDLSISNYTIQAVTILMRAKYTTAATGYFDVKDNGTEYTTAITLTSSAAWYSLLYTTMPNGGAAWTNARFNAFQIGAKVTAGTLMTVYEEYCMVAYLVPKWTYLSNVNGITASSIDNINGQYYGIVSKLNGITV